jgi:glycosyltransferase involved in cell wall biosynthesis
VGARLASLTVFFPCYNEEANVEHVTRQALGVCPQVTDDFEVLIVNDGSRDRTGEIADRLAAELSCVRAVHNRPNRGYGGALRRGFEEARKQWVFFTDGDGQFDLRELVKLPPMLARGDIVCGYRLVRNDPLHRWLNSRCWTTLSCLLFDMRVRDLNCAFKLLPRRLFDEIELRSAGALITAELLARARRRGYRWAEVGVHHYPRTAGVQTGANPKVILRAFVELARLWRDIRSQPRSEGPPRCTAGHQSSGSC